MRIAICVKQVPDTNEIEIDRKTNRLIREGVPSILNPFDTFALETAIRMKEIYGGSVTAFTMGPTQAKAVLKSCIAIGADEAYLVSDRHFGGSDTYATSYILTQAINYVEEREGKFDVIICGRQAADGDTAQVGPAMAEQMNLPQITFVQDVPKLRGGYLIAERETEDGYDLVEAPTPVVITVGKTCFELRYPTISGIMRANRREYMVLSMSNMTGVDSAKIGISGSPTETVKTFTPHFSSEVTMISNATQRENAVQLAKFLVKDQLV